MTHSSLTDGIQLTSDSSPRDSRIDRFIVHHAATTSLSAILSLFQPGGRTVSANYAMGNDGTLILAVDEDRRAWTSSSAYWDGRAVTIEVANSYAGEPWPVSDASFDKLARLIADVSLRYGFPINDDTVLTHQELYLRYGDSYATACPGDLQRRKAELLALANHYRANGATAGIGVEPVVIDRKEYDMRVYANAEFAQAWVVASEAKGTWQTIATAEPWLKAAGQTDPIKVNNSEWEALKAFYLTSGAQDARLYAPIEGGSWLLLGPGVDYALAPGEGDIFQKRYGSFIRIPRAELDVLRKAFAA